MFCQNFDRFQSVGFFLCWQLHIIWLSRVFQFSMVKVRFSSIRRYASSMSQIVKDKEVDILFRFKAPVI